MSNQKNYKMQAYDVIKQNILSNRFKPNEYLEEKMLCEMLGISRTPIREAINLLARENLVQVIQNKGVFVTEISIQSVRQLFEARIMLEPMILVKSMPNLDFDILMRFKQDTINALEQKDYPRIHALDYDFHNYINSCCKNTYLIQIMGSLSDQFQRVRTQDFFSVERTENGAHEHLRLIEVFVEGNTEKAAELLRQHIISTQKYYFKSLL